MSSKRPPLPSFVIIGAPGSATRWLRYNLDLHPEIYAPPRFRRGLPPFLVDEERLRGVELVHYQNSFKGWAGEPIVGALEPEAMLKQMRPGVEAGPLIEPRETARRMMRAMPEVRPILLARNPVDLVEIGFRRAVERGALPPDADLATMLLAGPPWRSETIGVAVELVNLDVYAAGMFTEAVEQFRIRFGDQLLVVFYEDICDDPAAVYRTVLGHVGASTEFVPDGLERRRYVSHEHVPMAPLSRELRLAVFDQGYRTQAEELEELTGRDLSSWDPALMVDA
jgi:hypothetical protein